MAAQPPTLLNGTTKTDANKNDVIENGAINGVKDKHKRHHSEMSQNAPSAATHPSMEPKTKEARILAKITYDDLGDDVQGTNKGPTQLNLAKVERYLHGPVPSTYNPDAHEEPREMGSIQYQILHDTDTWNTRTPHKVLVSATAAVNALGELSPGGALMRGFQEQSLARKRLLFFQQTIVPYHSILFCRTCASRIRERLTEFVSVVERAVKTFLASLST